MDGEGVVVTRIKEVGQSRRTPAKHALMASIYGREVGVVNQSRWHRGIQRLVWFDLTAGDGVAVEGLDWRYNTSPGINAYYATWSSKPVSVKLYEVQPATFDRLLGSLAANLPSLGYVQVSDATWLFGDTVILRARCGSGAEAPVDGIRPTDAVLASNDPNAITTWAMRPTFADEIKTQGPWCFRSISTMGCNAAGLKRSDPEIRHGWYDLINQQIASLPNHRDILLAAIEGDSSQWAYLLCEPVKWRENQAVENDVNGSFRRYGYAMSSAWLRTQRSEFSRIAAELFLTRQERAS